MKDLNASFELNCNYITENEESLRKDVSELKKTETMIKKICHFCENNINLSLLNLYFFICDQ